MAVQKIDPILEGKIFRPERHERLLPQYRRPLAIGEHSELFEKKDDYYILKSGYMERIDKNKIHHRVGPVILNGNLFIAIKAKNKRELKKIIKRELNGRNFSNDQKYYTLGPTLEALKQKRRGKSKELAEKTFYDKAKFWAPVLYYWLMIEIKKLKPYSGIVEKYESTSDKLKKRFRSRPKRTVILELTYNLIKDQYHIECNKGSFERDYLKGFGGKKKMENLLYEFPPLWPALANIFIHRKDILYYLFFESYPKILVVKNPKKLEEKPLVCQFMAYENGTFKKRILKYHPDFLPYEIPNKDWQTGRTIQEKRQHEIPIWIEP